MGLRAIKFEYSFNAIDCANCGMPFGVTPDFEERRRQDHQSFYCPHGHSNIFRGETEAERLQKRLDVQVNQTRMEREQRERLERKLKRVHRGVCPECNRSFANVERHMKSKHKEKR